EGEVERGLAARLRGLRHQGLPVAADPGRDQNRVAEARDREQLGDSLDEGNDNRLQVGEHQRLLFGLGPATSSPRLCAGWPAPNLWSLLKRSIKGAAPAVESPSPGRSQIKSATRERTRAGTGAIPHHGVACLRAMAARHRLTPLGAAARGAI